MEKYTEFYKSYKKEFDQAQIEFDNNPCKKTATILSNLRAKGNSFTEAQKFTKEWLHEQRTNQKNRFINYVSTLSLATKFERGIISESQFNDGLKVVDNQYPIK
jgi:hypothetical protein